MYLKDDTHNSSIPSQRHYSKAIILIFSQIVHNVLLVSTTWKSKDTAKNTVLNRKVTQCWYVLNSQRPTAGWQFEEAYLPSMTAYVLMMTRWSRRPLWMEMVSMMSRPSVREESRPRLMYNIMAFSVNQNSNMHWYHNQSSLYEKYNINSLYCI